jgi:hypothetical protein
LHLDGCAQLRSRDLMTLCCARERVLLLRTGGSLGSLELCGGLGLNLRALRRGGRVRIRALLRRRAFRLVECRPCRLELCHNRAKLRVALGASDAHRRFLVRGRRLFGRFEGRPKAVCLRCLRGRRDRAHRLELFDRHSLRRLERRRRLRAHRRQLGGGRSLGRGCLLTEGRQLGLEALDSLEAIFGLVLGVKAARCLRTQPRYECIELRIAGAQLRRLSGVRAQPRILARERYGAALQLPHRTVLVLETLLIIQQLFVAQREFVIAHARLRSRTCP